MNDSVFRFLLADETLRNSFIRTFTPLKHTVASTLQTNCVRPLKFDENLLNNITEKALVDMMSRKHLFEDVITLLSDKTDFNKCGKWNSSLSDLKASRAFFNTFSKNHEQICKLLLNEKTGFCDVVCELKSGELVLVEVQVIAEDALDKRFLAYGSLMYGNQLRQGDEWSKLKDMYMINLFEGRFPTRFDFSPPNEHRRHYMMTDLSVAGRPRQLPHLQMIQISLRDVDIDQVDDAEERWWLDFFKRAHGYTAIPEGCPPSVAAAYQRVRSDALPPAIRKAVDDEEGRYKNLTEVFASKFAEGIAEGRKLALIDLLQKGIITESVYDEGMASGSSVDTAAAEPA